MTATAPREEQLWSRCAGCASLLYRKRLRRNLDVCPECGEHARLGAPERLRQLVDPGSLCLLPDRLPEADPLEFVDVLPYPHRLTGARASTGLAEAVVCATATIGGHPVALAVMDFRFLGGSLGCAVGRADHPGGRTGAGRPHAARPGHRLRRGADAGGRAVADADGKTSQAIAALREAGLLTVSVLTDPTYGGVAASFATNTDLVLAERGARMGFAGPRVIRADHPARRCRRASRPPTSCSARAGRHGGAAAALRGTAGGAARRDPRRPSGGPPVPAGAGVAPRARRRRRRGPGAADGPGGRSAGTPAVRDAVGRPSGWPGTPDGPPRWTTWTRVFDGFVELHGDRLGADCPAIVGGVARFGGRPVMVIGHQKGHTTAELVARNFGMASPAGHRKALRLMRLAARLGLPVVTLSTRPAPTPG